jgi:glycosyltransferase involved in cell wall biosynthesis
MTAPIVLHIDTGATLRGGQRQLMLLVQGLSSLKIRQVVASPVESELNRRLSGVLLGTLSRHSLLRKLRRGTLRRIAIDNEVNIIHAHDAEAHLLGVLLKRRQPRLKLVVTRRVVFNPSSRISRRFKYGAAVDRFVAISRAVQKSLMGIGVPKERIEVIPSGLDLEALAAIPADKSVLPEAARRCNWLIAAAGALTREKDFVTAVETAARLSGETENVGLVILGEGPERRRLQSLIAERGLDNVWLIGHYEPLAAVLKACHLFLVTSTSEGLNTSAIEAAACGLPLVTTNVGGLPEVCENGYNGILCRPGDASDFGRAIASIVNDDALRRQMAANSPAKAKRFDYMMAVGKTADLYNRLLET